MIHSNSKKERSKTSQEHALGSFLHLAYHSGKLCNVDGIQAMDPILILSRSEEGTVKSNARNTIQVEFC